MKYLLILAVALAIPPVADMIVDWQFGSPAEGFTQAEATAHAGLVARSNAEAEQHHKDAREAKGVLFKPRNEQERADKIAEVFNAGRE
ncbi:hypothetical protein PX52LOC_05789 [Limnoglobus roseus]|uniref:Uncharacterized protein n=2 Tax=Limnoglobus roseus TaxID=2598579 RepID=A0A5C1ALZ1_9BACT|nr:hypothetical protein PX52LOC_05789 [Limnoglobus roseus]